MDKDKVWLFASAAAGISAGGSIGFAAANAYARHLMGVACDRPDATNLCGLTSAFAAPGYVAAGTLAGAVVGGIAATVLFVVRLNRRTSSY